MFQLKDFVSIVASEINHARSVTEKLTDFQPGSVARTLIEAPAVEMEQLYLQMFLGLREAIPVATFLSFGFPLLPARRALGQVSISRSPAPTQDIAIPMGTTFTSSDGRIYTSTTDVTWSAGESVVRVPVESDAAGLSGNIAAGQIVSSPLFDSAFAISNPEINTGADAETSAEREARFAEFVQSLSRGTVVACLYAARQAVVLDDAGNIYEYVTRTGIVETPGHVSIYVYSNAGRPSAALLADGQLRLDGSRDDAAGTITPGYRPAGVRVDVLAMSERVVPLAIRVEMLAGYTLSAGVQQALGDIFATSIRAVLPGETLYLGTLVEALLSVTGVASIVPVNNANIVCAINETLIPGALTASPL